jgi:tripartite-type tricarboxylate transporter receptor subunit TctC
MKPSSRRLLLACSAALVGLVPTAVAAQSFPAKPIRVINPASPGGNSDIFFRLLQQKMSEAIGQQFVMDYRPGAGGRSAASWSRGARPTVTRPAGLPQAS